MPTRIYLMAIFVIIPRLGLLASDGKVALDSDSTTSERPWSIRANATPLLLGGFGLTFGRTITGKVNMEIFINHTEMEDNRLTEFSFKAKHVSNSFGL